MRIFSLDKVSLSFKGANVDQFLNGISSNALDKPQNAFVNLHGRIIATFDQLKISADEYLIVLDKPQLAATLSHLDRYAKLSQIKITECPHKVFFDLDGDYCLKEGEWAIVQKKGRLIVSLQSVSNTVAADEFNLFRLKNYIPLMGIDYKTDEFLLNINQTDFVSFTKGCFLGQEPISKVHNRSKPTWRLVVRYEDECSDEEKAKMTSKVTDPQNHRTIGFVFVKNT